MRERIRRALEENEVGELVEHPILAADGSMLEVEAVPLHKLKTFIQQAVGMLSQ